MAEQRARYDRPKGPRRTAAVVDRETTCPFLLRVFVKAGGHHDDAEYGINKVPILDEHQLYTWKDATMRELLTLLRDAEPSLRNNPAARYSIRMVYFDAQLEVFSSREVGSIFAREIIASPDVAQGNPRSEKTLDDARFIVGDFLDIAYITAPAGVTSSSNGANNFNSNSSSSTNNLNSNSSGSFNNRNGSSNLAGRSAAVGFSIRGGGAGLVGVGVRGGGNFGGRDNNGGRSEARPQWQGGSASDSRWTKLSEIKGPARDSNDRRGTNDDKPRSPPRRRSSRSASPHRKSPPPHLQNTNQNDSGRTGGRKSDVTASNDGDMW